MPEDELVEEFKKIVADKGGTWLGKRINKAKQQLSLRCEKGHRFRQSAYGVVRTGHWCPTCAKAEKNQWKRIGLETVQAVAKEKGGKCLEKEYVNANQHAWFECEKGHQWEAMIKSVVHSDTWCPECFNEQKRQPRKELAGDQRPLGIEDCHAHADRHNGICLTGYYVNYMHPMAWRCERGHEWIASLHNMEQRVHYCVECTEEDRKQEWLQKCHELAGEHGGRCLSTEWVNAQTKVKWQCERGHEFESSWNNTRVGVFCSKCAREDRIQREGQERLKALAKANGGKWVGNTYKGPSKKYRFKCRNGAEFEATMDAAARSWAKYCRAN